MKETIANYTKARTPLLLCPKHRVKIHFPTSLAIWGTMCLVTTNDTWADNFGLHRLRSRGAFCMLSFPICYVSRKVSEFLEVERATWFLLPGKLLPDIPRSLPCFLQIFIQLLLLQLLLCSGMLSLPWYFKIPFPNSLPPSWLLFFSNLYHHIYICYNLSMFILSITVCLWLHPDEQNRKT